MTKLIIEGILFDATANEVIEDKKHLRLEPRVMQLLVLLAHNANKTVKNEAILNHVWPETIVTSDSISQCISQLRRIFNDDPKHPRVLKTIPKVGYRLIAPVRFIDQEVRLKSTAHNPMKIAAILSAVAFLVASLILYGSGINWGTGVGIVIAASTLVYIMAYKVSQIKPKPKT